ncbi:MAG TPA: hypothetical protein VFZ09_39870 [Archangium sp.]|nr:hypothetical protein [Archangium sp.]HEX5752432.1 hypothetical protein [Archangium sp.]
MDSFLQREGLLGISRRLLYSKLEEYGLWCSSACRLGCRDVQARAPRNA